MLVVRPLTKDQSQALHEFFKVVIDSGIDKVFHPHPFNLQAAVKACNEEVDDVYCSVVLNRLIVGYGMLRGYSEGYEIPSLGLCIHPDYMNLKLGQLLMAYLHSQAKLRGSTKIRLKVYKSNIQAIRLYDKLGYQLEELNDRELLGYKSL
jgi:[ribosomal protein S18]-alanine N-acetyltransferase